MSQNPYQPVQQPWQPPPQQQPAAGQYGPAPYAGPQGAPPAQGYVPQAPYQPQAPSAPPMTPSPQGYGQPQYAPPPVQPNMGGAPAWGQPRQPHPGMFAGINTAKPGGNYSYLKQPGTYWLRVDLCKYDDGRQTRKGLEFVAVEFTVIKVLDNAAGQAHTLGSAVCMMTMPSNRDYFQRDINKFLSAALGVPFDQVTPEAAMAMVGPQQPFANMVIEAIVQMGRNRQNQPSPRIQYKRAVPAAEVMAGLPPDHLNSFFPNGILQRMAAAEAAAGKPAYQPQPQPVQQGQAMSYSQAQPGQPSQWSPTPPGQPADGYAMPPQTSGYAQQAPQGWQPQAAAPAPLPAPGNGPPPGAWQQPR